MEQKNAANSRRASVQKIFIRLPPPRPVWSPARKYLRANGGGASIFALTSPIPAPMRKLPDADRIHRAASARSVGIHLRLATRRIVRFPAFATRLRAVRPLARRFQR